MIINKPHLKSWYLKVLETVFSLFFWSVVLYLLGVFVTAILWFVGLHHLAEQLFIVNDLESILDLSVNAVIYAVIIIALLIIWIRWNLHFYGGLTRRKARPPISDEQVSQIYNVSVQAIEEIREAKIAYILPTEDSLEIEVIKKL